MNIGFIGAGLQSRGIAHLALAAGQQVRLASSRRPEHMGEVSRQLPGAQVGMIEEVIVFADLIVIAIPLPAVVSLPTASLANKLIVDANNYYPDRDGRIARFDTHRITTSEWVAQCLPRSTVVKAFSAVLARDLYTDASLSGTPGRRALPVAGDDPVAVKRVVDWTDALGFDAVDAGPLRDSWRFERAKPAYCVPFDRAGLIQALAAAERNVELPHGSWRR
ncbi:NAD(P)-binding domain-containing protein [Pseudoxanthomonas sp. JBR18]|uniref:NADPH-dependent F420 reductase n=1 Tax=Pseudoxanthomonas sp. JBR18 TaxID=2969308 RepID=UPI0023065D52|nr:NAD(P)-binding domain-containing protein [Pseudoxanthomonas sp. JBR18]WCE04835.1 NAD(P)-binding domain-containing protein [Pseudoxanthomonas sp. JBR18]